jgi:hypothetical protein
MMMLRERQFAKFPYKTGMPYHRGRSFRNMNIVARVWRRGENASTSI